MFLIILRSFLRGAHTMQETEMWSAKHNEILLIIQMSWKQVVVPRVIRHSVRTPPTPSPPLPPFAAPCFPKGGGLTRVGAFRLHRLLGRGIFPR